MNKSQIISSIKNILIRNKEIFENEAPLHIPPVMPPLKKVPPLRIQYFYFPKQISPGTVEGYKLKDDHGYISLEETYKFVNNFDLKQISFTYRFITPKFIYLCQHSNDSSIEKLSLHYNFHYDMDLMFNNPSENNLKNHPPIHLQVLHPHPRFPVLESMDIQLFLDTVKSLCFKNEALEPYDEPIYSIRHVAT